MSWVPLKYTTHLDNFYRAHTVASLFVLSLGYHEDDLDLSDDLDSFAKLIHPDDSTGVWDAINDTFEKNAPFNVKFRIRKKDGSYVLVNSRANVDRDSNGKPILMSGVITDLGENQQQVS